MPVLPERFLERLKLIIPVGESGAKQSVFFDKKCPSARINTLKASVTEVKEALMKTAPAPQTVPWCDEALFWRNVDIDITPLRPLVDSGTLYMQGLSSMAVPVILNPQPGEAVLDFCAAPGSKSSQIFAMMRAQGTLVCLESVRKRYYKLKSVLSLMGADGIQCLCTDARRYRGKDKVYDKILVDAPCSSEGRFIPSEPKSFAYWSERKIQEMAYKQKGLLYHAVRLLRKGGTLVYSTCTFAPEENEGVIDWLLRKAEGSIRVVPIENPGINTYPCLTAWKGKAFHASVKDCMRILPDQNMEGFFIAKLEKTL